MEKDIYGKDLKAQIDSYYKFIKTDKNTAILSWKRAKKIKSNIFRLNFAYFCKYTYMNIKEEIRLFLYQCKIIVKYIIVSIKFRKVKVKKYNILSDKETVDKIVNEKYSICRYGDGEFKWAFRIQQNSFQKDSGELSKKLLNILKNYKNNEKILIGINDSLNDLSKYTISAKLYWKKFIIELSDLIYTTLPDCEYCNSNITRPYMDYKNKKIVRDKFENLKRIWNNREVIIIEGEYTKLGVGNDLLDNCKSIKRIICPAINAFDKYNEIMDEMKKQTKDKLFLISLGPTATILAYEMAQKGYQCIDIGHIDIEYMWFKNGAKEKEEVAGKLVNEVSKKVDLIENIDRKYEEEIIVRIG